MDDNTKTAIERSNNSRQRIEANRLCVSEAQKLLSDFVIAYEDGQNPDQMNILYGNTVELLSLWREVQRKTKEYLDALDATV